MGLTKTLSLSLLGLLLVGACAGADEESLLIRGTLNPRLEVLAPLTGVRGGGTFVIPRWQTNDVTGSLGRFGKYVEAPAGAFVQSLQIAGGEAGRSSLSLRLDAPGQPTTSGILSWQSFYPLNYANVSGSRYHFHLYPQAGQAIRQGMRLNAGTVLDDGKTSARIAAETNYLRLPKPGAVLNHGIDLYRLDLTRPMGTGDVDAVVALREYRNLDGLQRGTSWTHYGLRYSLNLPSLASVGAQYTLTQLAQGGNSPKVRAFGLNATSPVGSVLVANASLSSRRLSGAVERNGYTRGTDAGRVEVRYRGVRGLSMRAGYDRTEIDRVNHTQLATDETPWNKVWAAASYRPIRRWQVVARASHRSTRTPPASGLLDPVPLAFNLDRKAELRVEGTPVDNAGVYLTTNAQFRKNTRRNIEVQTDSASVGGWLQIGDRINLNADYGLQQVDSRNFILRGVLADSWVTTLGGTVTVTPRLWVESTFSNYRTSRAQNIHQNVWGVGLRRQVTRDTTWDMDFRRDVYDDLTTAESSYKANVLTVGGSARF